MSNKLPKAFKKKWIAALKSGEYKQGENYLKTTETGKPTYCCLGVACEVLEIKNINLKHAIARGDGLNGITKAPKAIVGNYEDNEIVKKLMSMNDTEKKSFKQIANWIDKNL